ncbi:siderophore-interacting protein [Actinoplanes subglobosus]|uniref:Siderophore-interacting protein n=1 Tax=Actinoplanes subglobosus TaxID=1547892 RepID=A0ABV8IXK4_9ACTN
MYLPEMNRVLEPRGRSLRDPQFLRATVRRVTRVVPGMCRVTLAGRVLADLPAAPPAAKVRLFLPSDPAMPPDFPEWTPRGLLWAPGSRTAMRSYTVRRHDRITAEMDVDMLLHHDGPGASWAAGARPGSPVGLLRPESGYRRLPGTALHLLVGDETALPALGAILDALPAAAGRLVVVETADRGYRDYLRGRPVRWLDRGRDRPGEALIRYVLRLALPAGRVQAFVAAEATATRILREHLRLYGLGTADGTLNAKGYWQFTGGA